MAPLYGRLKGRGKEKAATATQEITATLETWEVKVSLTLYTGGEFVVEVGEKYGPGAAGTARGATHRRQAPVSDRSVDPQTIAGDPIAYAARIEAQAELLEAAEAAVAWLYDRRTHVPPEMLEPREARHRRALREALRSCRKAKAGEATEGAS